ncbi:MAG: prepilin-type N-terminal cleavage/methylation domain-containing protein [candidate division Zixibacteria bacterium]|nr:prepilin-type N-terminal cleavage/methylation domain-containing protein [candidate division Zixibacteria bacterium]
MVKRKSENGSIGGEKMLRRLKNRKGLSLLEVLVAMLILAFGVLGLAPMIVTTMFSGSYSNEVTKANVIAQDKLEFVKNLVSFSPLPWTEVTSINGLFTRTTRVDVDTTDSAVPAGVYRISVNISWTDKVGKTRTINYYTYKMRT